jgi:hypothetical protein
MFFNTKKMPYFVKIGAMPGNKSGVGSRGYQLFRRGRVVIARWGGVTVDPGRKFYWRSLQEKRYRHRSEAEAKLDLQTRIADRIDIDGYSRLPTGARINSSKQP